MQINDESIELAAGIIRTGGIVLYPSDTVYGLGCDPFQEAALERLFRLKGRDFGQGVLLLIPELDWVSRLAAGHFRWLEALAEKFWPGPMTLVLKALPQLPALIQGREGTIALRLPDSDFLRNWMKAIPGPLVSTSANLSGQPPPETLGQLKELFLPSVDLFLEAGEPTEALPSTVVDLTGDRPRITRRGQVAESLETYLLERP